MAVRIMALIDATGAFSLGTGALLTASSAEPQSARPTVPLPEDTTH